MAGYYFLTLAALVVAGFFLGRFRAASLAVGAHGGPMLHSLPTYHGLYTAALILVPMLLVFVVGAPVHRSARQFGGAVASSRPKSPPTSSDAAPRCAMCSTWPPASTLGHALAAS